MKKTITLLTLIFTLSFTMNVMAQTRFGVKGGLNYSHVRTNNADLQKELSARPSFHLGVVGDVTIGKQLSFQPQLLLSERGTKEKHEGHDDAWAFTSLEIPLNVVYRLKDNGFFVGAGPVLGYNLSGKIKGHDESEKIELGTKVDEIKRFDIGTNAFAGYQLDNGLFFTVNYTLGLTNWSNAPNTTWRNSILGVSVGYFFKTKAKKG
jgi:hypothetical protein